LRDYAQRTRAQFFLIEHRVYRQWRLARHIDESHAIGTDEAQARSARPGDHIALHFLARRTDLGKTRTEYCGNGNFELAALIDHLGHCRRGHHDERVIDRTRRCAQIGIGARAEYFRAAGLIGSTRPG
jgi:hypothetical protein